MSEFLQGLKKALLQSETNRSVTENGAVGYKTTGKALLDLNFAISSMRDWSDSEIASKFNAACAENLDLAVVWLFFARDIRGGCGERRLFRVCLHFLATHYPEVCDKILPLIPEYGRWDDVFGLFDTKVDKAVEKLVSDRLVEDLRAIRNGLPVSLLAKWLPSINSHSPATRAKAKEIAKHLGLDRFDYQKICSHIRKAIHTVESQMSAGKWGEIDYSAVPSKANLIYKDAFFRHDKERRTEFLIDANSGEAKMNASAAFPYEIVSRYEDNLHYPLFGYNAVYQPDETLEAMWKALPNYVDGDASVLVMADGSGSMMAGVGNSGVTALDVANSLAIYFAERLKGVFHNVYMTFSHNPQLVNLGEGTLCSKLTIAREHDEISNTNIEAAFDLVLRTALTNRLSQTDLPKTLLIISDMEFDDGCEDCGAPLFEQISQRYREHGFTLPRLVFWNVNSRTKTIPLAEAPGGVALVSGFSPAIAQMVLSGELDPYKVLMDTLLNKRYEAVWEALKC